MKISIILPTYNEAKNIIKLISNIRKACKNIPHEIIVVDDHSPDKTLDLVKKNPHVRSFLHPGPRGLALSILYSIKQSRSSIILGMDADGNHDPKVIPQLLSHLKHADLVVASRFLPGGGMENRARYWCSFLFNKLLQCIGFPIRDNTSGFYAIRKATLQKLHPDLIYQGYGEYHMRLVWLAKKAGLTIIEVPVYYEERRYGTSKSRLWHMFLTYTKTALQLSYPHQNLP